MALSISPHTVLVGDWVVEMSHKFPTALSPWAGCLVAALIISATLYSCCSLDADAAIDALTQEAADMEQDLREERAKNASYLTYIATLEKCRHDIGLRGLELVTHVESQAKSLTDAAALNEATKITLSKARARIGVLNEANKMLNEASKNTLSEAHARISELEEEEKKTTQISEKLASNNRVLRVNNLQYKNADIDVKFQARALKAAQEETVSANNQVGALADQKEKLATKVTDLERQLAALRCEKGTIHETNEKLATKVTDLERQLAALRSEKGTIHETNEKLATKVTDLERQLAALRSEKGTIDETNKKLATKVTDLERQLAALRSEKGTFDKTNKKLATKVTDLERQLAALRSEKGIFVKTCLEQPTGINSQQPTETGNLKNNQKLDQTEQSDCNEGVGSQDAGSSLSTGSGHNTEAQTPSNMATIGKARVRGIKKRNQKRGNRTTTQTEVEQKTVSPLNEQLKIRNHDITEQPANPLSGKGTVDKTCPEQSAGTKSQQPTESSDLKSDHVMTEQPTTLRSEKRTIDKTCLGQPKGIKRQQPTESSDLKRETDEGDQVSVKPPERKIAKAFPKRKRNLATTSIAPKAVCFYRPHDEYGTRYPCVNDKENKCCGDPLTYDEQGKQADGGLEDEAAVQAGICMACYVNKCIEDELDVGELDSADSGSDDLDSDDPNAEVCYYQAHGEKGETYACGSGKTCCGDPGQYDHSGDLTFELPGSTNDENVDEAIEQQLCFFCYLNTFCYYQPHDDDQIYRCTGRDGKPCCGDPSRYDRDGELKEDRLPPGWSKDAGVQAATYTFCVECYFEEIAHPKSEEN